MRALLAAILLLLPSLCRADEVDPAEAGHAVAFILIVSIPSLICLAFGVWLAVVQFRSRNDPPDPNEPPPRIFASMSRPPHSRPPQDPPAT